MKLPLNKRVLVCLTVLCLVAGSMRICAQQLRSDASNLVANPAIQQLVNQVSRDSIIGYVRKLEAFGTRYEYTSQRDSAATYIFNNLKRWGYSPASDVFSYSLADYIDVEMADQNNGWVIGQDARDQQNFILRTSSAGVSWIFQVPPAANNLTAVDFVDASNGWIVGSGGGIFRTSNGGASWQTQNSPSTSQLLDVSFFNTRLGIAVGYGGALLRTPDGGATWTTVAWGGSNSLRRTKTVASQLLWIVGSGGVILSSRDTGATWAKQSSGVSVDLSSLDFADSLNGWVVGSMATILRTVDGGNTWTNVSLPSIARRSSDLKNEDVAVLSPLSALVLSAGEIWKTDNGGSSWKKVIILGTHGLRKLGPQTVLTFGGSSGIYRTTDAGASWQPWDQNIPRTLYSTSRNITVTNAGALTPDREYLIVAHYDSPLGNDPGGDNNGSGVAVALEAMRLLKNIVFESSIRFVATSGKETGLLGSNRFVSIANAQGRDIRLTMNLDMVGYPVVSDTTRSIVGSYLQRSAYVDSAVAYNARYSIGMKIDTPVDSARDGDVYPFDFSGYQALQVSEGTIKEIAQGNPYLLRPTDTSDKLNRGMVQRTAQLITSILAELAKPATVPSKQWTWKTPFDHWNNLRALSIVDANTAFVAGELGTIIKTTNGGRNWTQQASGTSAILRGIWFTNASRGFAVGDQGALLRTTNGGTTWTPQTIAGTESVTFYGVSFADANTGTIVGDYGSVYRTTDGGATWSQQIVTPLMTIYSVSYLDKNKGIFVGSLGSMFGTTDGGSKWTRLVSGIESVKAPSLLAANFSDVNNGTAVGEFGTILRTTDGGVTWFPQQSGTKFHLRAVQFTDARNGFAVGDVGLILATTDGGTTWTERSSGLASWFAGLQFANIAMGLVVGSDGMLQRTTDGGITWTNQIGGPRVPLYAVRFVGPSSGLVAGYQGSIYATTDGGVSWDARVSGTTNELRGMDFVDQYNGIIVGDQGTILRTSDGGSTWLNQTITPRVDAAFWFNGVAMTPSGIGLLVGRIDTVRSKDPWMYTTKSAILRTTDGGKSWSRVFVPWTVELTAVSFGGLNVATVVGTGFVGRTTDRGLTWFIQSPGTVTHLTAVSFAGSDIGVAVGDGGVVLRTIDGGTTWTVQPAATTSHLKGVWTPNGINFIAVGIAGAIIASNDGGVTWGGVATDATQDLYAVYFSDIDRGTIVGDKGTVLRTVAGGVISIVETKMRGSAPAEFSLAQNYPNPFNGMTTLEFQISRTSSVLLKLFDLLGREVVTLVDDVKAPGSYRLRWDAKNLSSGIYFCRLSVGDAVATQKMILLK